MANAVGAFYMVASILGWWAAVGDGIFDNLAFEALIVLATLLFFRSAMSQPGRWRRPWLLVSAGLLAALVAV